MSIRPGDDIDPASSDVSACDFLETVIVPRAKDLGGFEVRRALPAIERRMIGPFVFLDQMGPAAFAAGKGVDVRPHPHINLATVTYLYAGEIFHRDTLGSAQAIRPGDLNWMSAGRGIAHSERTAPDLRAAGSPLFGLQAWVALPADKEESDPTFAHYGKAELPMIEGEGKDVRVIAGALYGQRSPAAVFSELFYADVQLSEGASLPIDPEYEERGLYVSEGEIDIAGDRFEAGRLLVFKPGDRITIKAVRPSRFMLLGGASLDGPRHMWWNFISSRKDRIEQAKEDWKAGRFGTVPGDDKEFIPLPE
ncbi:MAG: pirin family protein [Caulobacterales bacterium]|jgi:redox-sensitive bicupin YhaK (pirin superfamily)|nr:pirin family protein [Caulobacterales bacterium]